MEYCELTELQIEKLRLLIGNEKVLAKNQLSEDYGHDELGDVFSMPSVLIKASCTEDISLAAAFAYENDIPYVVRGSGTGLVGAAVAVCGGMVIETTGMNKILELDEDNLCVTVEPGVLLMELAAFAEKNGYLYPPDPGEKSATIGGNISTNAGGMRAVKYGVTRDFVRGLEVVLPDGEIMNLGGKVVKNSSGYSLKDLIIGSEGTLAIITKAILKLVPKPAAAISMLVPFEDIKKALDAVPRIISVRSDFTAIEFMERNTVLYSEEYLGKRFPDSKSPAYLLLTVDGDNEEEVAKRYQSAAELCMELGAKDVYLVDTEERKDSVWKARGAFLEAIRMSTTQMDECDVVVPRSRIGEFIKYTYQVAEEAGVRIPSFGHAGDGNLHIYICRDELGKEEFYNRLNSAFDRLYQRAAEMGGQVSGEHGIGYSKRKYLANQLGERQMEIMRGIKAVFDPKGLLNPHKVV